MERNVIEMKTEENIIFIRVLSTVLTEQNLLTKYVGWHSVN